MLGINKKVKHLIDWIWNFIIYKNLKSAPKKITTHRWIVQELPFLRLRSPKCQTKISSTIKCNHKKCPLLKITLSPETGSVQLHCLKAREMSTSKLKIVFGSPTAISTWENIEKQSISTTNLLERQTMTIITFSKLVATTPYVCTMTPKEKHQRLKIKVHFKRDFFSTLLIRRMTKSHSCNTIKNWVKVQKTNWL